MNTNVYMSKTKTHSSKKYNYSSNSLANTLRKSSRKAMVSHYSYYVTSVNINDKRSQIDSQE